MVQDEPRFSTGLLILADRPGLLWKCTCLKDLQRLRVLGNYETVGGAILEEKVNTDSNKPASNFRAHASCNLQQCISPTGRGGSADHVAGEKRGSSCTIFNPLTGSASPTPLEPDPHVHYP